MLRPLLEVASDWIPPAGVQQLLGGSHFALRAGERGVVSVPGGQLLWLVGQARQRQREDLLEPVFRLCPESTLHRIILPEGAFYPVIRGGVAVTIYSPFEKRQLRRARRLRRRVTGSRHRQVRL